MRGSNRAGSTSSYATTEDEVTYLSSKQIWDMLIRLLYLSLRPLANQSTITFDLLFVLIGSTTDQRRKLSVLENKLCLDYSYRLLFQPPDVVLRATLYRMGTERTVYQWFLEEYLKSNYEPEMVHVKGPVFDNQSLMEYTKDFYELYCEFREKTAKRFIKLSASQAAKNHWSRTQFGLKSDKKDNEHNYFLSALKGVDKFYPGQGTLAGYIMPWLKNAGGSQYTLYVGEAFNLSRPVRKMVHDGQLNINNKSFDLDKAKEIPQDPHTYDDNESQLIELLGKIQISSDFSLLFALNGVPGIIDESEMPKILEMCPNLPSGWKIPKPELDDFPILEPLSRASRKDTPQQRRRKEFIDSRRRRKKENVN